MTVVRTATIMKSVIFSPVAHRRTSQLTTTNQLDYPAPKLQAAYTISKDSVGHCQTHKTVLRTVTLNNSSCTPSRIDSCLMGPCIQVKLLTFSRRQMSLQLPGLPYLPLQYLEQRSRWLGPEVLPRRRLKKNCHSLSYWFTNSSSQ